MKIRSIVLVATLAAVAAWPSLASSGSARPGRRPAAAYVRSLG